MVVMAKLGATNELFGPFQPLHFFSLLRSRIGLLLEIEFCSFTISKMRSGAPLLGCFRFNIALLLYKR